MANYDSAFSLQPIGYGQSRAHIYTAGGTFAEGDPVGLAAGVVTLYAPVTHTRGLLGVALQAGTLGAEVQIADDPDLEILVQVATGVSYVPATHDGNAYDLAGTTGLVELNLAATTYRDLVILGHYDQLPGRSETGAHAIVQCRIIRHILEDELAPPAHAASHLTGAGDAIQAATGAQPGLATAAQITKLDGIEALADVTGSHPPQAHAASHTDGTDDIADATAATKGLATAAQITKLDGIEALADVTGSHPPQAHAASHQSGGGDQVGSTVPVMGGIPMALATSDLDAGWLPRPNATDTIAGTDPLVNSGAAKQIFATEKTITKLTHAVGDIYEVEADLVVALAGDGDNAILTLEVDDQVGAPLVIARNDPVAGSTDMAGTRYCLRGQWRISSLAAGVAGLTGLGMFSAAPAVMPPAPFHAPTIVIDEGGLNTTINNTRIRVSATFAGALLSGDRIDLRSLTLRQIA